MKQIHQCAAPLGLGRDGHPEEAGPEDHHEHVEHQQPI
ncbi:hypothetical protein SynWH8103_02548 [Synechococcus sp. WH 8103]|nr:hypothetical protein SynBOUM118_02457 [Synechococcus sp. BOUM118]QNJ15203.1 hypothetical protein SynA18461_02592 [Synechococcus sp. A18-46.1]QNJ18009.1 hypothetical protein SynA1840_02496 [Synechococcus sp. A18-40]CRY93228.1 hypothetical protein SynWH8103_02548 [Synechococcus sp. WH 8103]